MTDEVIRWHLSGFDQAGQPFVAGIYPMLRDETCFFLAVDFDKEGWREDAGAFLETCRSMGIPAVLERSRSGHGGHVWLFFEEAVTAAAARRLGSFVLTETMERRPDIGFGSYDRFFPNQDTLPHGGFGNLIALPLQKQPRDLGNSVFLDDHMVPYLDQWAFLSSVERIGRSTIEDLVREAESRGRVVAVRFPAVDEDEPEPWTAPPPAGGRILRSSVKFLTFWNSCWGTRSTSRRTAYLRDSETGCSEWRLFRMPSSTRLRLCGCLPTTSRGLLRAPRSIRSTSACLEAAWRTCNNFYRT